jgi:hypothetical protein
MVNTSRTIGAYRATPIDAPCATADRGRVSPISIIGVSPKLAGRLIDVEPRTIAPVFASFLGEVRPVAGGTGAFVGCEKALMSWHRGTTTPVFGGFDKFAVDIQNRVGPPPPSRPSV